jgi:uncharacterized protein YceK
MNNIFIYLVVILISCVSGCASLNDHVLDANKTGTVQLRNIQTRIFDTNDQENTLRTIIATLQDLKFVIDKADLTLSTVSATKLNNYAVRMTVSIRKHNEKQLKIRATAEYNSKPVIDPQAYQDFFASLAKALFLEAHLEEHDIN